MANRFLLQSGGGVIALQSGGGNFLLQSNPPPLWTLVQSVTGTNTSGTSITVVLGAAPTPGNLLVGRVATNDPSFNTPSGWTRAATGDNVPTGDTTGVIYRVAQSGDTATVTIDGFAGNTKLVRVEERYVTAGYTVALDQSGSSAVGTSVTTITAGTSGTLANANEFACAVIAIRALTSSNAATSPFSLDDALNNASAFSGNFLSQVTSATTAVTPTSTWTTAGDAWGCFATFQATAASGSPYTLAADPATFTVSAAPAALAADRNINAAPASYTYTAQAAQLIVGRAIIASAAAYTVAAQDATMLRTYALVASPAAYVLTAFNATLATARALSADPVVYTLTAAAATLTATRALSADSAAYVLTAQDATLSASRSLAADPAAYTFTAFDVDLAESGGAGLTLDAQPAAYAVAAFDTGLAATRAINAAAAAYTVTAQAATLAAARNVNAGPAAYAVAALDAGLAATKAINAGAAAYTLTAANAELLTGGGTDVLTSTDLANITAIVDARVAELQKIWVNKMTTDPATGLLTIYDDDNTTPIWQGPIYEDVAGTQPYRDKGADRRDKLT